MLALHVASPGSILIPVGPWVLSGVIPEHKAMSNSPDHYWVWLPKTKQNKNNYKILGGLFELVLATCQPVDDKRLRPNVLNSFNFIY